jgi:hypothetical protein
VEEWKQARRDAGLSVPDDVPPPRERADYAVNVGAALPGEQRLKKWTEAACVAAVARYLAQLPWDKRSSKRGYDDWAKQQNPRAPASSNFDNCERGGWGNIRRKAMELATV